MNSKSTMAATLIDPQLELMDQGIAIEGMQCQYPLPTSAFEPWGSMFESMGEFPRSAQEEGMMDSDLHSDESSSVSLSLSRSLGADQDLLFPLSPPEGIANVDESPGNTSISAGLSEAGTNADKKTSTATKAKRTRRRRSEAEKKEQIKQRNRVAASKCRQKKKEKVDELKEIKSSLEARNKDLLMEYRRLRQEVGQVKSHLIHHTECNDPNIDSWVENEAKGYVQKLLHNDNEQRIGSIGSADGFAGAMHMRSVPGAGDPYMGLG
ncbi:transcriptional regulator family: bZIP [Trichoderma harzianum]|uniref:BZIP transcriptional regulator n=1 Tax=Trichoderma guizhouense TaxID=1491466 RepID=A0A1T3CVY1_9HYPO|nr:transcriptional regulator family: bZIP [Trichoderma harzianum]OPB45247.1 bZIP transcriptional regulator [Trichoderma guizhouense]